MEYAQIGYTKKTHGIGGELKVFIEEPYEELFLDSDRVFLEVRGTKQPFFIEHARGGGDLIVKFEDINVREDALLLQSKGVFLPASEVPEIVEPEGEGLQYGHLAGYLIVDESAGEIGPVEDVFDLPQQEMALVHYQGREVLIPLNPAFIRSVDDAGKRVLMDLPEGLLSL